MESGERYIVQVYVGAFSAEFEALSIEALKCTSAEEMVACIVDKLHLDAPNNYELAEVIGNSTGQECKERRLDPLEHPVGLMLLWPKVTALEEPTAGISNYRRFSNRSDIDFPDIEYIDAEERIDQQEYRFYLREKLSDANWSDSINADPQLIRDYFYRFLYQPRDREYPDLCQLPDLNEETLLENLRARFHAGHIYTYVGSILIAVNPFKFYPIYNPKYVKLYQNRRLGELPPHIFAVADAAYHAMMRDRRPQCIVISGESGSGKTESTNFLLHHLTALSQKGSHGSGVEQTILNAGPVLEAFGNAKTCHNNNSSRFGKFIQVTYRENGQVHGALVQKYLLEKSRICFQAKNERNYHVFYHLLVGSSPVEKAALHLQPPQSYRYLNQSDYHGVDPDDSCYELSRLKQSMEMVGFSPETQRRVFAVLSAVLHIGNVEFQPRKSTYHHDESVHVKNPEVVTIIANLLKVREEVLHQALISKRARTAGEMLIINYRMPEAIAARDAMAKCLYGSLFDWIVLQVNHALLAKKDPDKIHSAFSIGVLDIFGFEDFGQMNSFEQFCINYANEHLQYYFNQHVFKYEQEEYRREGIHWVNIQFVDNTGCLYLFESKPNGLFCILDDQCNFPGATNETLLQKLHSVNKENDYYEVPQKREAAFIVRHYAGKVKYQVAEFREKNLDLMRADTVAVLKSSQLSFVRELVGADPVAVFRWAILRAFMRAYSAFVDAGKRHRENYAERGHRQKGRFHPDLKKSRLTKNRAHRSSRGWRNLESVKTLAGRLGPGAVPVSQDQRSAVSSVNPAHKNVKKMQTVGAQFQISLQSLLVALNNANPFFVRCIKSNRLKAPNQFDDEIVLRQLRYTGMLETVRIRQAGFNVRLSFDEFIHHYRILLPRGLLSSQADVIEFIESMNLNSENYQIGHEKIFLRESEKAKLDHRLHQTILASIVTIQRWFRTCLERRNFLALRSAVVKLQSYARMFLAQRHAMNLRMRHMAATVIQKVWRGYKVRRWYSTLRESVIGIQSRARGNLARQRYEQMKSERRDKEKGDAHSAQSTDEAFLSKGSSQEELDLREILEQLSSEESSGIQEDSEPETEAKLLAGISVGGVVLQLPALLDDKPSPEAFDKFKSRPLVKSAVLKSNTKDRERETPTEKRPALPTISTTRIGSIEELLRGQDAKTKEEKSGAIQRAKKHWKSFLGGSKRPEKSDMNEEQDNSDSESTLVSTSASRSTSTLSSFTDLDWDYRSRDREYRREERKRIIAERHPMRSRANSITDDASLHSPTPSGASSVVLHRRFSRDVDPFPLGSATASLRRGSKEGVRSISIDSSLRGSRDSLRGAANLSRRDSYVSASTASPKEAVSRTSSETGSSAAKPSISEIHKLNRANKFYKGETCALCQKTMSAFFVQGYKCSECGLIFHSKCVQQGLPNAQALPQSALECVQTAGSPAPSKDRSKRKNNRERADNSTASENSKWNLTKTSEFTDSVQNVITSVEQLQRLDEFIARKIHQLGNQGGGADRVFLSALRQFKSNLISHYGVAAALKHPGTPLNLSYRDLIENFDKITESVAREEPSFPVTLAVNAFRGFLNEFVASERKQEDKESRDKVKFKRKRHKERAKKNKNRAENEAKQAKIGEDSVVRHLDHEFATLSSVVTIPTACEVCSSFTWLKEKGLVCQGCKLTCHKKCFSRITARCPASGSRSGPTQPVIIDPVHKTSTGGYLFGVALDKLIRSTSHRIPIVIERLITTIELVGLYTEGLYRKSGVSSRVQHLKKLLEDQVASGKSEEDVVDLKEQPVHVLTAVLKSFLREMPQPLLTFERYDDFLRVADIVDVKERTSSLMNLVQELPQPHFDLLERLVFHLTRVALNEKSNRMNANALAIVFAPCILRTSQLQQAQDSLSNVAKHTLVVETILNEQLSRVTEKLANIDTLDTACLDYTSRLGTLRASKLFTASEVRPREATGNETSPSNEEQLLQQQIDELREEKAALAATLPSLARSPSDEDLLSTDGDIDLDCEDFSNAEGSLDDLRSSTDSSSKVTVSSSAPVYKVIIPVGGPADEEASRPEWEKRLYAAQKVFEEQAQFLSQSDEVDSRLTNRRARIHRSTQIPRGSSQSKLEKISVTLNNDGSIVSSYQDVLEVDLDDDAIMV